jgi:hypothetical protein
MGIGVPEGLPVQHHGQRHWLQHSGQLYSVQHCVRIQHLQPQANRRQQHSSAPPTHLCRITNQHTCKAFPNQRTGTRVQAGPHSSRTIRETQRVYSPTVFRALATDSASEAMLPQETTGAAVFNQPLVLMACGLERQRH